MVGTGICRKEGWQVADEVHEVQVPQVVEDDRDDKLWVEPLLLLLLALVEPCLEEQQRHKYWKDRIHLRHSNCVVEVGLKILF